MQWRRVHQLARLRFRFDILGLEAVDCIADRQVLFVAQNAAALVQVVVQVIQLRVAVLAALAIVQAEQIR